MSESPEEVMARIRSEELAKGSDPRVAEARAKAAQARAQHGLPIDPQEAWPLKLEREGREASAPRAEAPAAGPAETVEAEASAEQAEAPVEAPAPEPAVAVVPLPAAPAPAAAVPAAPVEPYREPEVGEIVEPDAALVEIGGVKVSDARLPRFVVALLLAITGWAMLYLITDPSPAGSAAITSCVQSSDGAFTCFSEETQDETSPGAGSAGH